MVVIGELKLSPQIARVLVTTCGSPSVQQDAAACAIRVLGNSVVSLVSACLLCRPKARSKFWSSLSPGGPAMTNDAVLG